MYSSTIGPSMHFQNCAKLHFLGCILKGHGPKHHTLMFIKLLPRSIAKFITRNITHNYINSRYKKITESTKRFASQGHLITLPF